VGVGPRTLGRQHAPRVALAGSSLLLLLSRLLNPLIRALIVLGVFIGYFSSVIWPLAVAAVLALILRPVIAVLERRLGLRRSAAVVLLYGVFLLLAVKHPARHRSLIAFGGWSTLAHASTMLVMSIEAWSRGAQRRDSPQDIVIVGAIGLLLLAVLPARDPAVAHTERSHSPRTSVHPDPVGA